MPLRYFPACRAVEFFDPDDHDRRVVMLVENLVLPKGKEPGAKRWRRLLDIPESDPAFCLFEASEPNKMALGGGGAMGFGEANSCAKNASNEH
ncbi:hypothetical protein [Rhodothalassium salexigens]|nr:hypothetical protein [Rhodothalassium salexigens]